jgi:hypothetical protein
VALNYFRRYLLFEGCRSFLKVLETASKAAELLRTSSCQFAAAFLYGAVLAAAGRAGATKRGAWCWQRPSLSLPSRLMASQRLWTAACAAPHAMTPPQASADWSRSA